MAEPEYEKRIALMMACVGALPILATGADKAANAMRRFTLALQINGLDDPMLIPYLSGDHAE